MTYAYAPPTVVAAVLKLDELGECRNWSTFAMVGRYNAFVALKRRALVEDVNEAERKESIERGDDGIPYERYPPRWRLTANGRDLVERIRAAKT